MEKDLETGEYWISPKNVKVGWSSEGDKSEDFTYLVVWKVRKKVYIKEKKNSIY